MNAADFFATAVLDGRVLGVGPGSTPEEVERALGAAYLDDVGKRRRYLRRDYGLAEFAFTPGSTWTCTSVMLQVHRLAHGGPELVPAPLRERYGAFPDRLELDALVRAAAAVRPGSVLRPDGEDGEYRRYRLEPATATIVVLDGGVWSISLSPYG